MSYADKYYFNFKDFEGNSKKLTIQEDGYAGSTSILTGSGDPVVLTYSGEGTKKYEKYTFGSKLTFSLYNESTDQYNEFLNTDDRQYKFILEETQSSATKYTGSLQINSLSSQPYTDSYALIDPTYCNLELI